MKDTENINYIIKQSALPGHKNSDIHVVNLMKLIYGFLEEYMKISHRTHQNWKDWSTGNKGARIWKMRGWRV